MQEPAALIKIASNCSIMTSLKECPHLSFFSLQLNEKRYGGGGEDSVAGSPPPGGGGGGTADRSSLAGGAAGQGGEMKWISRFSGYQQK